MWFKALTGFDENVESIYSELICENDQLHSKVNGRTFWHGQLTTPSVAELHHALGPVPSHGALRVRECVADVQALHQNPAHAGACFQVASQFNLLEMVSPHRTPEHGVSDYQYDHTQGPACAIACGAGTIYRNYFVDVAGTRGQSNRHQLDMMADLAIALGNPVGQFWQMRNGYLLPSVSGLHAVNQQLQQADATTRAHLSGLLRVGVQAHSQVTLADCMHRVTQVYCSALPVAYSNITAELWLPFAQLVLDAAYDATFAAAVLNSRQTGNNTLFLTLLGGGAFGNKTEWITSAIAKALRQYQHYDLEVQIVSYGSANPAVQQLLTDFQRWR